MFKNKATKEIKQKKLSDIKLKALYKTLSIKVNTVKSEQFSLRRLLGL